MKIPWIWGGLLNWVGKKVPLLLCTALWDIVGVYSGWPQCLPRAVGQNWSRSCPWGKNRKWKTSVQNGQKFGFFLLLCFDSWIADPFAPGCGFVSHQDSFITRTSIAWWSTLRQKLLFRWCKKQWTNSFMELLWFWLEGLEGELLWLMGLLISGSQDALVPAFLILWNPFAFIKIEEWFDFWETNRSEFSDPFWLLLPPS